MGGPSVPGTSGTGRVSSPALGTRLSHSQPQSPQDGLLPLCWCQAGEQACGGWWILQGLSKAVLWAGTGAQEVPRESPAQEEFSAVLDVLALLLSSHRCQQGPSPGPDRQVLEAGPTGLYHP